MIALPDEEATAIFVEGKRLAELTGDTSILAFIIGTNAIAKGTLGFPDEHHSYASKAVELARQSGDEEMQLVCQLQICYATLFLGRFQESIDLSRAARSEMPDNLHYGTALAGQNIAVSFDWIEGTALSLLGRRAEGRHLYETASNTVIEVTSPNQRVVLKVIEALGYVWDGNRDAALAAARSAVEIAGDYEEADTNYPVSCALGFAHFVDRDWSKAVAAFDQARIAAHERYAGRIFSAMIFGYLTESLLKRWAA